jgi:hypothetical protein
MNYNDYGKLIKKISWSWHRTTGIDLETLISEANVVFVECLANYDSTKRKFSTHLWSCIGNKFNDLVEHKNRNKYDGVKTNIEFEPLATPAGQEKRCILANIVKSLSDEAQQIVSIVLEAPADLLHMLPKPELSKSQLTKYLRLKGWKIPAIDKAYVEIGNNLNF